MVGARARPFLIQECYIKASAEIIKLKILDLPLNDIWAERNGCRNTILALCAEAAYVTEAILPPFVYT
jgi:hypothetical protein